VSYVVLARKWRPMRFDDLVGQDHVARTLGERHQGEPRRARVPFHRRARRREDDERADPRKALNCLGDPATTPPGTDRADRHALPRLRRLPGDRRRART
jgi:DNA polymerase-3 subunit gamma/tau